MKKILSVAAIAIFLSFSNAVLSGAIECGALDIRGLTVQAERTNGSKFANTMRILVDRGKCEGIKYAYLSNSKASYASILSLILSRQAQGKTINVYVRDSEGIYSGAREIEWVSF